MTAVASPMPRSRGRWINVLLLAMAASCLPLAIGEAHWFPEANRLVIPAILAVIVGVVLGRSPLPSVVNWIIALMLGVEVAAQVTGGLFPPIGTVIGDIGGAVAWAWNLAMTRTLPETLPFARTVGHILAQGRTLLTNIGAWSYAVRASLPTEDVTVLVAGMVIVVFMLSWVTSHALVRGRNTFVSMLPLGVAIITAVGYTDYGLRYAQIFMALMLLTLVSVNIQRIQAAWVKRRLDASEELTQDALRAGAVISAIVVIIALIMPYVTYYDAVWAFWNRYGSRLTSFYDDLDRAFAGRNPMPEPTPGGPGIVPHSIQQGPSLGEDTIMLVTISDPAPLPEEELRIAGVEEDDTVVKRYWRARTYDTYTGHGWESNDSLVSDYEADEVWREVGYPSTVLTQTYEIVISAPAYAFAVNEPVALASDYRVFARSDGDLAAFSVGRAEYTVVSRVPDVGEAGLLEAEGPYPDEIAATYLSLPEGIPNRVTELAAKITSDAGADSRYAKARAIERYIRNLEYDTEIEPPPLDADVVDYFLFTVQRGYCDYSATSMVVLLRSVGVASRYASGFAMGTYDYSREAWLVRERNAHAWVEVYFPELGWIEFEPTPIQRIFVRRGGYVGEDLVVEPVAPTETRARVPFWGYGVALALLVAFVVIWPPKYIKRRKLTPRESVWNAYGRLVRLARMVGVGPHQGQTSGEYLVGLGRWMEKQTDWDVRRDITLIARTYQRARYSEEDVTNAEWHRVEDAWRQTRSHLVRLLFSRSHRRKKA